MSRVWPGNARDADPNLIPPMKLMGDPNWNVVPAYLHYRTDYQLINDNLLDFSHIAYVHQATFGGTTKWADELPVMKRHDNGFSIERWMENVPPAPFIQSIVGDQLRQDIRNTYDFYFPGVLTIDTCTQPAGTGTREKMAEAGLLRLLSWQAVTPETEGTTHYFYSTAAEKSLPREILTIIHQGTEAAFEEDRRMIGAQQALLLTDSRGPQISIIATAHDVALTQMRNMIKRKLEAENA